MTDLATLLGTGQAIGQGGQSSNPIFQALAQVHASPSQLFNVTPWGSVGQNALATQNTPAGQSQPAWMTQGQNERAGMNAAPYVLDPSKLTTDTAANTALMYPSNLQTGMAPYTSAGGQNIGPALQSQGVTGGAGQTLAQLTQLVSQQTGMTSDQAKQWIMSLIPASQDMGTLPAAAAAGMSPTQTTATAGSPYDVAGSFLPSSFNPAQGGN